MQIGVRLEREVWGVVLENSAGVYFLWQSWDSEFKSLNVEYQFGWGAPLLFAVGLTGVAPRPVVRSVPKCAGVDVSAKSAQKAHKKAITIETESSTLPPKMKWPEVHVSEVPDGLAVEASPRGLDFELREEL